MGILKAFFDGSGQDHDSTLMTLAGIAAPAELWPEFEQAWMKVLQDYHLDHWHTADAMSRRSKKREFVKPNRRKQWNPRLANEAKEKLRSLVFGFLAREHRNGFQVLSCTIDMDDYETAKSRNCYLRPPEAICVNAVCGVLKLHKRGATLQFYFDQGEPFMKQIEQVWRDDRKKPKVRWAKQVSEISATDSKRALPIQAADLIAWEYRQNCRRSVSFAAVSSLLSKKVFSYYDLERIQTEYPRNKERGRLVAMKRAGWSRPELRLLEKERL